MVEIHNNIKEEPAQLFYSENKLEYKTVDCILNTPNVTLIGVIENSTAWYDVRAQVYREYKNGVTGFYYVQYKGQLIELTKGGKMDFDNIAPFEYFEEVLLYLLGLGDYPTVELKDI